MESATRDELLELATTYKTGNGFGHDDSLELALGLLAAFDREAGYQSRIVELQDAIQRTAASGVENATRYAADIDRERRAGAAAVARIRDAIGAGATEAEQHWAGREALEVVDCSPHPGTFYRMARAFLALSESHAEARALLLSIGERALALVGKRPT